MIRLVSIAFAALVLAPVEANAAPLQHSLSGLDFLVGHWASGAGQVADTGGTSKGSSDITAEAGGAVLLRRDHTELFDKAGKPAGGFSQIMTIYAEAGAIHADYFDGAHIIHYTSADVVPGKSVTFSTTPSAGAPAFHLTYRLAGKTLNVAFAMAPPGQPAFHPIATGTLQKRG